jgi:hypothetical protein
MELAVPLLALGGLYVASNQDKKKKGMKIWERNKIHYQIMIYQA